MVAQRSSLLTRIFRPVMGDEEWQGLINVWAPRHFPRRLKSFAGDVDPAAGPVAQWLLVRMPNK